MIGRSRSAGLTLHDEQISGRHLEVRSAAGGGHEAVELGSTNGTRLDGQALEPGVAAPMRDGSTLVLGACVMVYRRGAAVVGPAGAAEDLGATVASAEGEATAPAAFEGGDGPAGQEIGPTQEAIDATVATSGPPVGAVPMVERLPVEPGSGAGAGRKSGPAWGFVAVAGAVLTVVAYLGWRVFGSG